MHQISGRAPPRTAWKRGRGEWLEKSRPHSHFYKPAPMPCSDSYDISIQFLFASVSVCRPILSASPLNFYVTILYANKRITIVNVYYKLTLLNCWSPTATLRSSVTLTQCLIYMYCILLDSGVVEKQFAGATWGWGMGAKLQGGGIQDWCIISSSQVPRGIALIDFLILRGAPETYLDWTPRWRHGKFACLHGDTWIRIHASGCMFPDTYIRIQSSSDK